MNQEKIQLSYDDWLMYLTTLFAGFGLGSLSTVLMLWWMLK